MRKLLTVVLLLLAPMGLFADRPIPSFQSSVGGKLSPDGKEISCDLPNDLQKHNLSSRGQGCCVFRSLTHSAYWQNVPALIDFAEWVKSKNLEGGGYPGNVKERITAISKERGLPEPAYLQVEGGDIEILKLACKSGRMPAITYSMSETPGRYSGRISHMVSLVFMDDRHACILDSNYPGVDKLEWITIEQFRKSYAPGWAVILLDPPPPPPPKNRR